MSFVAGIGHANCDIFYVGVPRLPNEGEEALATDFEIMAGGGVPATLSILSRLGVPTHLVTYLGTDMFSTLVEKELRDSGMAYENLYQGSKVPVVVSSTILTPGERTFVTYNQGYQPTKEQLLPVINRFAQAEVVEMQIGMPEFYREIRRINRDVVFVLDTGWWDDLSLENYRDYLHLADYYTPNRKEALKITGTATPEEAIRVLARYFRYPIVKLDTEGCLLMKKGEIIHVPPLESVRAVDSTGAGDAFLSGLLYGLFHHRDIEDCVLYGNITGGTCVQNVGCLTFRLTEEELLGVAGSIKAGQCAGQ